jgi:antitoxin component YwqK of YwqJK toxin-antitoxin module
MRRVLDEELTCDVSGNIIYYNGELFTGIAFTEYPNGKIETEIEYKDGSKHGFDREWYEDGTLEHEYRIKNGLAHGISIEWNKNGGKKFEGLYENGVVIYELEWDNTGKLVKEYRIENDDRNFPWLLLRRKTSKN